MVERAPRQDVASADLDITDVAVRSVCRIGRAISVNFQPTILSRNMIGYFHHNVVCLSVCPSVCL